MQDQSETPAAEITKTDEIINSKPDIVENTAEEEEGLLSNIGDNFSLFDEEPGTTTVDTSDEATLDAISPQDPSSLKNRLKELEKACGGKKK